MITQVGKIKQNLKRQAGSSSERGGGGEGGITQAEGSRDGDSKQHYRLVKGSGGSSNASGSGGATASSSSSSNHMFSFPN